MFWCVPKFCYRKRNVSFYSKNFKTKPNCWCVPDIFKGTFLCIPKHLKQNQNFLVFQNFFSDSGTFLFIPKTLKQNQNILKSPKKFFVDKTELFECFEKFKNKTNHLLVLLTCYFHQFYWLWRRRSPLKNLQHFSYSSSIDINSNPGGYKKRISPGGISYILTSNFQRKGE
jgi:hypothetical protein